MLLFLQAVKIDPGTLDYFLMNSTHLHLNIRLPAKSALQIFTCARVEHHFEDRNLKTICSQKTKQKMKNKRTSLQTKLKHRPRTLHMYPVTVLPLLLSDVVIHQRTAM